MCPFYVISVCSGVQDCVLESAIPRSSRTSICFSQSLIVMAPKRSLLEAARGAHAQEMKLCDVAAKVLKRPASEAHVNETPAKLIKTSKKQICANAKEPEGRRRIGTEEERQIDKHRNASRAQRRAELERDDLEQRRLAAEEAGAKREEKKAAKAELRKKRDAEAKAARASAKAARLAERRKLRAEQKEAEFQEAKARGLVTVWKKRVDENGVARYAAEENWKLFDECEKKQKAEKEQQRRNRETASSSAAASSLSSLSSRTESDDLVLGHHAAADDL